MKKKRVTRLLSLAMIATLVATMTPSNFSFVRAEEVTAETQATSEDGINDAWTQENVVGDDAICAVEDGWLHIKSGTGNGNNPGTNPAMFVNPNEFNFDEAGYFEFTMKTANANTGISDSDRFGVYLGYNTDQNGMFIGYDNGGWFWQKYQGGNGDWYSGSRVSAPAANEEVAVRLEWTADKKATLKLDGTTVFNQEDFSGIAEG